MPDSPKTGHSDGRHRMRTMRFGRFGRRFANRSAARPSFVPDGTKSSPDKCCNYRYYSLNLVKQATCRMKKLLFILLIGLFLFMGCGRKADKINVQSSPELVNPVLKECIIDYVRSCMQGSNNCDEKFYKLLTIKYTEGETGTQVYTLDLAGLGLLFFMEPRPLFIKNIEDIYIAFYNQNNIDFQMPIEDMVKKLEPGYPSFGPAYKEYLNRRVQFPDPNDKVYALCAFDMDIWDGNYWILKFSNNKLIQKTIVSGTTGKPINSITYN